MLFWLRVLCLTLWAVAAILLSPSAYRFVMGRFGTIDEWRAPMFITALVFVGGMARWLFFPESLGAFAAIHVLTAIAAVYVIVLVVQGRSK